MEIISQTSGFRFRILMLRKCSYSSIETMMIGVLFALSPIEQCLYQISMNSLQETNNFNQMQVFQTTMNTVLKSLLKLSELQLALFHLSNLKILNSEQLSKSPFIADELSLAHSELTPIKTEIEDNSQNIKKVLQQYCQCENGTQQQATLARMVTRVLEVVSSSPCEQEIQYYRSYNQRLRMKCERILRDIASWSVVDVLRVLYKYYRHIALIQLERYEEILQCMKQNDFQSIKYFREYFYNMLQKKESKQKQTKNEEKAEKGQNKKKDEEMNVVLSTPFIPQAQKRQAQKQIQALSQKDIEFHPKMAQTHKSQRFLLKQQHQTQIQTPNANTISMPSIPPQQKGKSNLKYTKKLFSMLSSVMDIKKQHFVTDILDKKWQQKSLYSDLFGRNKVNHNQIEQYYNYSQLMADRLNTTEGFYYYQEEPQSTQFIEQQLSTQRKRIKVTIPSDQHKKLFSCEPTRKQPSPQLTNPLKNRKDHKTVHKSINCRPRMQHLNAQIQQKPIKLDSQFLEINLRKVLPTRRQSQMEQMVIRASSLNNLRHDLHHKRIIQGTEKAVKAGNDVFKSVKILHQGQIDPKQQMKTLREVKEKTGQHHSRINSWINEELRHQEFLSGRPDEVRRMMALQKIDL